MGLFSGGSATLTSIPLRGWLLEGSSRFLVAIGLAASLALTFAAAIYFEVAGARGTRAADLFGLAAAQLIAAISCLVGAKRASPGLRRSWALLGASTVSAVIGRLISSAYEIAIGPKLTFPSPADAATLAAVVLGLGAILALPSAPSRASTRSHALLNSLIAAVSLFFIVWVSGLADIYWASGGPTLGLWLLVGYVCVDVIVLAVLWRAISRARGALRSVLVLLGCAFALIALTTIAIGYLTAAKQLRPVDQVLDTGFVAAFLMIALAPLWPGVGGTMVAEGPVKTSTVITPPAAITVVVLVILGRRLTGHSIDSSEVPIVLGALLMFLLTMSQVVAHRDSLHLLAAIRRSKADLGSRTVLLDQVISHTPAGLARVGLGMRIIDANPRMGSLFGASSHGMTGLPLSQFLPAGDVEAVVARFRPFEASTTDTVESDNHARRLDGSEVWVRWSITAIRDAERKIEYFLLMFDDIDAAHAAQQTAIANLAGLERLSRLKSEFISMISHEFRTALTGIQGFSELMHVGDLDAAEMRQLAAEILNDAQRLNRLISSMLELDRIEAGRMPFRFAPVDLCAVAVAAVERARASTSKHLITLRLDPALPCISGDRDRLMQVLTNLLSNAVKYSPNGGRVVVAIRTEDAQVTVSVKDQGCGMRPEFMDQLFDRYERYETKLTRMIVGTGLGLVITRRIIEAHGGRIWANSKAGVGSEFHFSLPLTKKGSD